MLEYRPCGGQETLRVYQEFRKVYARWPPQTEIGGIHVAGKILPLREGIRNNQFKAVELAVVGAGQLQGTLWKNEPGVIDCRNELLREVPEVRFQTCNLGERYLTRQS